MTDILFLLTLFLLGFRHGFDFDHIAAISDITGATKNVRKGFIQSSMYVLGHTVVVCLIGVAAIFIGFSLPETYASGVEVLVGLSLIALGIYLLYSLFRNKASFKPVGRGGLLVSIINKISGQSLRTSNGSAAAFFVGVIHGIGAETPSQILLLSLAGTTGKLLGSIGLFLFLLGLVLANTIVSLSAVFGYSSFLEKPNIRIGLGVLMAIFSLYVGFSIFSG